MKISWLISEEIKGRKINFSFNVLPQPIHKSNKIVEEFILKNSIQFQSTFN